MSYKEKLVLEQLNKAMPELESKKATLTNDLNQSTGDYTQITALSAQLASVTAELEAAELRWLALSEKQ
jgi:ATP-binding cassette subfamily F protein uup